MPIISIFFGIVVRINFFDHAPPHLHAAYGKHEALIDAAQDTSSRGGCRGGRPRMC